MYVKLCKLFFFIVILNYALCVIDGLTLPRQLTELLEDRDVFYFPVNLLLDSVFRRTYNQALS